MSRRYAQVSAVGIRTFTAVYGIVFGRRDEAIEAALRVRTVHDRVHVRVTDPLPSGTWFTRLLAPFNYSMAAMLLPVRGEFIITLFWGRVAVQ